MYHRAAQHPLFFFFIFGALFAGVDAVGGARVKSGGGTGSDGFVLSTDEGSLFAGASFIGCVPSSVASLVSAANEKASGASAALAGASGSLADSVVPGRAGDFRWHSANSTA